MVRAGTGSDLIEEPGHGLGREMNLGECRNLGMGQDGDGARGLCRVQGSYCGLSRRSVQRRGLVLNLGQGRDELEPVKDETGV